MTPIDDRRPINTTKQSSYISRGIASMTSDDRVLTFDDLRTKKNWPYTAVHTRRLILQGKFPKPFKSGEAGLNLWLESEIDRYLNDRQKAARKEED